MRYFVLLILLAISFGTATTNAQNDPVPGNVSFQTLPPSPEASAITQYATTPVSYYTGIPQINIPIHNFKRGTIELPISLSYHASGIKVDQWATWSGIGWSLQAGGAITRTVFGMADDVENKGFIDVADNPQYNVNFFVNGNDQARLDEIEELSKNCMDAQPDAFFFNFNGITGKFAFDWDGNLVVDSKNKLQITYERDNTTEKITSWTIVDDQGTTYTFGAIESNHIYQHPPDFECLAAAHSEYNSAWFLTKITGVNEFAFNTLNFDYTSYQIDYGRKILSESIIRNGSSSGLCPIYNGSYQGVPSGKMTSNSGRFIYHGQYLSSIETEDQDFRIEFKQSLGIREDIPAGNTDAHTLESIHIKKRNPVTSVEETIKKFNLEYDYSTGRLTLKSIQENNNGDFLPPYKFNYFPGKLPSPDSRDMDYWGYYNNGNNHTTLVPVYRDVINGELVDFFGADREPRFNFALRGTLQSIIFPTGGVQEFEYEPNDYSFIEDDEIPISYLTATKSFSHYTTVSQVNCNSEYPKNKIIEIEPVSGVTEFEAIFTTGITYTPLHNGGTYAQIYRCNDGSNCNDVTLICEAKPNTNKEGWKKKYMIGSGFYKMVVSRDVVDNCNTPHEHEASAGIEIKYPDFNQPISKKITGGFRIASIIEKDHEYTKEAKRTRTFKYHWPGQLEQSSGVIYQEPSFSSGFTSILPDPENPNGYLFCDNIVYAANNPVALGATRGSHIGYRRVEEWNFADLSNGKTVYEYTSPYEHQDYTYGAPVFQPPTSYNYKTGLLKKQTTYANEGGALVPLKQKEYTYTHYDAKVEGLKVWSPFKEPGTVNQIQLYKIGTYHLVAGRSQPLKFTNKTYSEDGLQHLETTTDYTYDSENQYLITKHVKFDNNNEEKTTYTYPTDYTNPSTEIAQMVNRNWVSPSLETVVETKTRSNASLKVTQATFLSPSIEFGANLQFPKKISTLKIAKPITNFDHSKNNSNAAIDSRYTTDQTIDLFDYNNGLPLQITNRSGITEGYCYDPFEELILRVVNAGKAEVYYNGFENGQYGACQTCIPAFNPNNSTGVISTESFSGKHAWQGNGQNMQLSICNSVNSEPYLLSFWAKGTSLTVVYPSDNINKTFTLTNEWERYSVEFHPHTNSSTMVQMNNVNGYVDEIRIHPKDAEMFTYNHDYLVGPVSIMEQNGKPTHYEYDNINRLRLVRDHKRGIVQRISYDYSIYNTKPIDENFDLQIDDQGNYTYKFTVNNSLNNPPLYKYEWDFGDNNTETKIDQNFTTHQYAPISIERIITVRVLSKTDDRLIKTLKGNITIDADNLCQELGEIKTEDVQNGVKLEVNNFPGLEYTWRFRGVKPDCPESFSSGYSVVHSFPGPQLCTKQVRVTLTVKVDDKVCTQSIVIINPN